MITRAALFLVRATLLSTVLIALLPSIILGQDDSQVENIQIQQADFRGRGYEAAGRAAFQGSKNDVVVVLVCGARQDVIDATEAELKVLTHEGYNRVAMIIADPDPTPEDNPVIAILVNNENPSHMTNVSVHSEYRRDLYSSVREAYEQYILFSRTDK